MLDAGLSGDLQLKAHVLAARADVTNALVCEADGGFVTVIDGRPSFGVASEAVKGPTAGKPWEWLIGIGERACPLFDLARAMGIGRILFAPPGQLQPAELPPFVDASKPVMELGELLDDSRLPAEYGYLSGLTSDRIPTHRSLRAEAFADVRMVGQRDALTVPVTSPTSENIFASFAAIYQKHRGEPLPAGSVEILSLHVRRTADVPLPEYVANANARVALDVPIPKGWTVVHDAGGIAVATRSV